MAAGQGFKTFTTGEVLTAADVNGYLMQGVNVFADAAARTAAITSPQEGQMSFLKDTNSTEYYSGSAWVAVAGASGGMTLISTTTLTGASVTLSSIPQTYKNLQLIIRNYKPATDGAGLYFRFNADSTASRHMGKQWSVNTSPQAFAANYAQLMNDTDNTATTTGLCTVDIPDYTNTSTMKMFVSNAMTTDSTTPATDIGIFKNIGYYNQTTAISSIQLLPDSGNFTSGTALLYGVS